MFINKINFSVKSSHPKLRTRRIMFVNGLQLQIHRCYGSKIFPRDLRSS
jgi:hypothetical protein